MVFKKQETHQIVWRQKQQKDVITPIDTRMCNPTSAARPLGEGPGWHSSGFIVRPGNKTQNSELYELWIQCSTTLGKSPFF